MSNFEIEKVFKEINNENINKNFTGIFSSDKINNFVMFEKIMPGKNYPFIVSQIQTEVTKAVLTGGVF